VNFTPLPEPDMNAPLILLVGLLACPLSASASIDERGADAALAERAEAHALRITDADAFVAEVEDAVRMAQDGVYGRLKRGSMPRLERARDLIVELLDGRASAMELTPDDRVALYNAQEEITATLNRNDKGRKVCKREPTIGSRLAKTECLTIAEREARARNARENTDELFRSVCHEGPGNACGR
jgi:hypothetical protein